jgi:hypothetical protein
MRFFDDSTSESRKKLSEHKKNMFQVKKEKEPKIHTRQNLCA